MSSTPAPAPSPAPTSTPTQTPTPAATVLLIPWDPESPAHVDRMYEQRVACGWKAEQVESWTELQRSGKFTLQWVVLDPADPAYATKISKHSTAYPKQSTPLLDTATSLGGKPRLDASKREFMPVGHISLNTEYEEPGYVDAEDGLYFIATFWISPPLQSSGLGRASMDAIERMATSEPLNARVLALSTWANRSDTDEKIATARWTALGREPPKLSNQDWYERRGYVEFKTVSEKWSEKDKTGKEWWFAGVFMRKEIS